MLHLHQAVFSIGKTHALTVSDLRIAKNDFLAIVGSNGSGKTSFANLLKDPTQCRGGEVRSDFRSVLLVSFERQLKLFDEEWQRCNTDYISDDESLSTTVADFIAQSQASAAEMEAMAREFGIGHLMGSTITELSSGEGRKLLLVQALLSRPDLLILDEPFDGLDIQARQFLTGYLEGLHHRDMAIVLIVNRIEEIPSTATQIGWLLDCHLERTQAPAAFLADPLNQQLLHAESELPQSVELPGPLHGQVESFPSIARLRNISVHYGDHQVLSGLDWEIRPQEHWHISGPNGCGKSTLLNLITGDNPQCYANDIQVFGIQRGSGESIWDLKKRMGIVSPALHQSYRVGCSVLSVVLSGFHDSIGLYETPGDKEVALAHQWLQLIGMGNYASTSFLKLSYGQQRLLLIVRGLVKHPPLLILDEPLQGLDPLNRLLVLRFIDRILEGSSSTLLFVSHHAEDIPGCVQRTLQFVPEEGARFRYEFGSR
nr:molybdate ABC transporter ATP-binding protein ModF [uncultured Holophaga sp.]